MGKYNVLLASSNSFKLLKPDTSIIKLIRCDTAEAIFKILEKHVFAVVIFEVDSFENPSQLLDQLLDELYSSHFIIVTENPSVEDVILKSSKEFVQRIDFILNGSKNVELLRLKLESVIEHQIDAKKMNDHFLAKADERNSSVDLPSDGVLLTNEAGEIVEANKRVSAILGYSKDEFKRKRIEQLYVYKQQKNKKGKVKLKPSLDEEKFNAFFLRKDRKQVFLEVKSISLKLNNDFFTQFFVRELTGSVEYMNELLLKNRAIDAANDAVVITDTSFDNNPVIYVNEKFTQMTGYTKDDVIGNSTDFLEGPKTSKEVKAKIVEAINTGNSVKGQIIHYRKDGTEFWNELSLNPVFKDNKLINYISIQNDVSESHDTLEKLRKYEHMFSESSDLLCVVGLDGYFKMTNESFSRVMGYDQDELLGRPFLEFVHPDDKAKVIAETEKIGEEGESTSNFVTRYRLKNGEYRYLQWNSTVSLKNEEVYAAARDITNERNIMESLTESEERLSKAIESMPVPIMIYDEDGNVLRISEGWERYSGYLSSQIHTVDEWSMLAYGEKKALSMRYIDILFKYQTTINEGDIEIRDNHGKKRVWNFHSTPLGRLPSGKRLVLSTAVDLTASKRDQAKIKELNRDLEQKVEFRTRELRSALDDIKKTQSQLVQQEKMASLGQLSAGLAHEINNPMNFIAAGINNLEKIANDILPVIAEYDKVTLDKKGFISLEKIAALKEQSYFDEKLKAIPELIADVKLGVDRTTEIISGLRTFSRKDQDNKTMFDVHQGLDSSLLLLRNKTKGKITIEKKYDKQGGLISCFPGQLNQVFLNILSNAIDAMNGEGKIIISTFNKNDKLVIRIKDTGMGMSTETKDKIFEPFYTTKDVGKGVGLGLSISYGIIEKHEGHISVTSHPNKGTEFKIELPIA